MMRTTFTCDIKRHCKRPAKHLVLYARALFEPQRSVSVCEWHWKIFNAATRIRFWKRKRVAGIGFACVDMDKKIYAFYRRDSDCILVTQHFAAMTPEQQVYTLSHETIHRLLAAEFGMFTCNAFDLIYKRGLPCLGHRSLHTFELNRLYEQAHQTFI